MALEDGKQVPMRLLAEVLFGVTILFPILGVTFCKPRVELSINLRLVSFEFAVRNEGDIASNLYFVTDAITPTGFEPICGPCKANDL